MPQILIQSKMLNKNEFRKLVNGKNIKVTLDVTSPYQNIKRTKLFRSPKLVLSAEGTRFGLINDRHYLEASPVDMIIQRGNIIVLSHVEYDTIKWTVEILGDYN